MANRPAALGRKVRQVGTNSDGIVYAQVILEVARSLSAEEAKRIDAYAATMRQTSTSSPV